MNYKQFITPDTFIGIYMKYMSNTETATDYDFWCALWLMSMACERNVIVDRPNAPVFLNLYAILVADSGVTRKSTAVRMAAKFANELCQDNPMIGLIEGKTLPEQLDAILHMRAASTGRSQIGIAVSELAVFLGIERYNAAMPALLTDLYDCPESRKGGGTISRGPVEQTNIFVSFLSASTPAWLLRSVNPNVVQGGFTSRCMFILSEQPKRRIAWADQQAPTEECGRNIGQYISTTLITLRELAKNYKVITINESALKAFRSWYARRGKSFDAYRASFESREDAHILRVAAFLCINDNSWIIQYSHIRWAIRIIEGVKLQAARLFSGRDNGNKFVLGIEAIRDALLAGGLDPTPRSKLYLKVRQHLDTHEFSALLDVMLEMGAIQRFEMKHNGAGRPIDLIRGTKLLATKGITDTLMEKSK